MSMNFATNLLPNTNKGFDLGSSSLKWNIYGEWKGDSIATTYLPSASSSAAGITTVGASGGAAAYSHTHAIGNITSSNSNRLAYTTSEGVLYAGYHYVDDSSMTVGKNTAPASGYVFKVDGASQLSGNVSISGTITAGTWNGTAIGAGYGGTGQSSWAKGDILYASAANTLSKLSASTNGYVLKLASGVPTWAAEYSYTHPTTAGNKHIPSGGAQGDFLTWSAAGTAEWGRTILYKSDTANNYCLTLTRQTAAGGIPATNDTKIFRIWDGSNNMFLFQVEQYSTASQFGIVRMNIGNATASGTAGNYYGKIRMYHPNTLYTDISATQGTLGGESSACFIYYTRAIKASAVYGAVWNDYAEFRRADNIIEKGRCVIDQDNGVLTLAQKRLMPGAQIVSDTYGFAIGETEEANTPTAVSGRVLVYPYRDRSEYHAGMAVCSAPNGTVDIMTREEIKEYPDCIVGIVSEIPDYDTWGTGNVAVNGRIWIKVR